MDKRETGIVIAGSAVGTAQTWILREYIDDKWSIEQLGNWGKPSVLLGIVGGGLATVVGAFVEKVRSEELKAFLVSYGVPALVGGILSGIFPKTAPTEGARLIRTARPVLTTGRKIVRATAVPKTAATPSIMISE